MLLPHLIRPLHPLRTLPLLARHLSTKMPTTAAPLLKPIHLTLLQLPTGTSKSTNLSAARTAILRAAPTTNLIVLPECFNSPYGTQHFPHYAEPIPLSIAELDATASPSTALMSQTAKDARVHLVAGSIPEKSADGKLYNTSLVFGPTGEILARHRKVHLFDIDIPGKIRFQESEVLSAGEEITVVEIEGYGKIAVAICYDVRFPEMAMVAARRGCWGLVYPGAFNLTTGPLHWELLARARAVDNQVWVAMCSPARVEGAEGYTPWGESLVVDPSGVVVAKAGCGEEVVTWECTPERMREVREGVPVTVQRRFGVYKDVAEE